MLLSEKDIVAIARRVVFELKVQKQSVAVDSTEEKEWRRKGDGPYGSERSNNTGIDGVSAWAMETVASTLKVLQLKKKQRKAKELTSPTPEKSARRGRSSKP